MVHPVYRSASLEYYKKFPWKFQSFFLKEIDGHKRVTQAPQMMSTEARLTTGASLLGGACSLALIAAQRSFPTFRAPSEDHADWRRYRAVVY